MSTEESLYEHLFPLTTLMKQRVVENFSGDTLNERWTLNNAGGGGGTAPMSDSIDGGVRLITNGGSTDQLSITFDNIRQYSPTSAISLFVAQRVTATNLQLLAGFADALALSGDASVVKEFSGETFKQLITSDNGASASTNTTVNVNTNFTAYKIENKLSTVELSILGNLEATRSTLLPNTKLQPFYFINTVADASVKEARIRYCEAFNI